MALSEEATTKIAALLRLSTLASGAALAIMSIVSFFASIALLSPSAVIVAFYTVIGGALVVLAELQFQWFLSRAPFFESRVMRGVFCLFVGSLTFATNDFSGVISILTMVTGGIIMAIGVVQLGFALLTRHEGSNTNPMTSDSFAAEMYRGGGSTSGSLADPNFNPDAYDTYHGSLDENGRY